VIVNAAELDLMEGRRRWPPFIVPLGRRSSPSCRLHGGCATGDAKIRRAPGKLRHAKHIVHAVGPVWCGGSRRGLIAGVLLSRCG